MYLIKDKKLLYFVAQNTSPDFFLDFPISNFLAFQYFAFQFSGFSIFRLFNIYSAFQFSAFPFFFCDIVCKSKQT